MSKRTLEEAMREVNKKFKSDVVRNGLVFDEVKRIPFSSPRINYMTYGGIPVGRIIEFAGEEGGGKTTTALDLVGHAQKLFPDKQVLYVDIERTLDAEWAQKLGVDVDSLILFSPDEQTAEEIMEAVKTIVETGDISLCILDSLAAMVSAQAYSKTIEDKTYGGISMALTLFSKEMIPVCARTGCAMIGINQIREDMNSTYGGTTTTGGRAWRHNCSVRMEFRKSDYIDDKGNAIPRNCENPTGHLVKVSLIKSKVCKLDRKVGFYTLKYLSGIDYISDIIDLAIKAGFVNAAGAWYSVMDYDDESGVVSDKPAVMDGQPLKFQGKARLHEFLETNEDWREELNERIFTHFS